MELETRFVYSKTKLIANFIMNLLYGTIVGLLSGAIHGDHISPISDTTVLSSLASDCKLMNQVITQAPYAIIPGTFAMVWVMVM